MDFTNMQPAAHARHTYEEVERSGPPSRPLDFPEPVVSRGVRVNALVVHPTTGQREILQGVIHKEELLPGGGSGDSEGGGGIVQSQPNLPGGDQRLEYVAYWPRRRLQDAIYGSVWACLVLRRHYGEAADDAARAAGVEPGSPAAPTVWEVTGEHVAIKMVEWANVHRMRGRLLEDPVKEIAAMQLIGADSPHVLGSTQVLQDDDFLYSVMPYCSGGDLFGVVVNYAEENDGEGGMPEPVARYWFRQVLVGIHHLQARGVCHRDLSLENILVNEENCAVIDMGMCLRVPYSNSSGGTTDVGSGIMRRLMTPQGVCGKHNYMSPEIFQNQSNFDGFTIDMWAAGVILYIMLTGFPPYDQASITDQRLAIIGEGYLVEQLDDWGIKLSEEAGDLLQRMMQLEPNDRPTLAEVMMHPWVVEGEVQPPQL